MCVCMCICLPTHVNVLYVPLYERCSKKFAAATDDVTSLKSEMKTITEVHRQKLTEYQSGGKQFLTKRAQK